MEAVNEKTLRNLLTEPMQLASLVGKSATAREKLVEWCEKLPEVMAAMEPPCYVPIEDKTRVTNAQEAYKQMRDQILNHPKLEDVIAAKHDREAGWNFVTAWDLAKALTELGWPVSVGWKKRPIDESLFDLRRVGNERLPQRYSPQIAMIQSKLGLSGPTGEWDLRTDKALKEKLIEKRSSGF